MEGFLVGEVDDGCGAGERVLVDAITELAGHFKEDAAIGGRYAGGGPVRAGLRSLVTHFIRASMRTHRFPRYTVQAVHNGSRYRMSGLERTQFGVDVEREIVLATAAKWAERTLDSSIGLFGDGATGRSFHQTSTTMAPP